MNIGDTKSMNDMGLGYTDPISEAIVYQAYILADRAHRGQTRKYTKEPYIEHPVRVARLVREYYDSPLLIASTLLHDVIEDTHVDESHIRNYFDQGFHDPHTGIIADEIARCVVELTNVKNPDLSRPQQKRSDRERIADITWPSKFVKLCDRLDNITGVADQNPTFAETYLTETDELINEALQTPDRLRDTRIGLRYAELYDRVKAQIVTEQNILDQLQGEIDSQAKEFIETAIADGDKYYVIRHSYVSWHEDYEHDDGYLYWSDHSTAAHTTDGEGWSPSLREAKLFATYDAASVYIISTVKPQQEETATGLPDKGIYRVGVEALVDAVHDIADY